MKTISVLFAEKNGVYSIFKNIDIWGVDKDARNYNLENPVIAHPPCQLWGRFAKINYIRWGGLHNKPFNDKACFSSSLFNIRRVGGVLEHPAHSYAWEFHQLKKPIGIGWNKLNNNEYVCEVFQSSYGHLCNKKTWLFYKGNKPHELDWRKVKGTHQIGFHDQRGKNKNKPTISGKRASATPIKFAAELLKLARNSID